MTPRLQRFGDTLYGTPDHVCRDCKHGWRVHHSKRKPPVEQGRLRWWYCRERGIFRVGDERLCFVSAPVPEEKP